jgi:dephospho-CoA kinase
VKVQVNVAIAGKMGSGKSALANYLEATHGYLRLSTSAVVRAVSTLVFGDEERHHLNALSDAVRRLDPNVWIAATLRNQRETVPLIVDSVRYVSEAEYLRSNGFQIWRIQTPHPLRAIRLEARGDTSNADDPNHATEREMDDFDYDLVLDNVEDGFLSLRNIISSALSIREHD